ncbi:MAG: PhoH family protein [Sedimentisphaerales bacterium]|nr:PhoH family protein [Sedimentisphaerales bacterium]
MEVTVQLDPDRQLELFGPADSHLRLLRRSLGVQITARHSDLHISGTDVNVSRATEVIDRMQKHLLKHRQLTQDDVTDFIEEEGAPSEGDSEQAISVFSNKVVEPSTEGQLRYIETMRNNDITFCTGPAGTGKTYLAVAVAVSMLKRKRIRRIVLARPAVEAGEKLGFLPGDIAAKVNPYLRPLFDAIEDMMDFAQMRKFMELDIIEIIPLAFMRGRTLNEAAIICDEAQNTSGLQMLMVLTRLGHGSKMIITGDITQVDLADNQRSGMVEAMQILQQIHGIGIVELSQQDIVRHRLVQDIVEAYKTRQDVQSRRRRGEIS